MKAESLWWRRLSNNLWCVCASQVERAFQKQFGVTGCFKSKEKKAPGKSGHRYHKSVGLGFKTPKEAIEGGCLGAHTLSSLPASSKAAPA